MDAAARYSQVNLIADPLYGYIEITKGENGGAGEQHLLDTPWLQRLRRIHQLQSAWWVFPTAEHSRFAHLLGAMHLAGRYAGRVEPSLRAAFPDAPSPACVEETLRVAGLLHDVGHGPFGHFFDREVLSRWHVDHEDIGRRLVCTELADIIASLRASPSGAFARGEFVDPRWVAWVMAPAEIDGYTPPPWLRACKPILCGPATVDNLDYVVRDAYMCGVGVGSVDVQRIMHYSFVFGDTLVLHGHAVPALEMFLTARLYLYNNIYFHRTVRRIDLTMREIFADTVQLIAPANPLDDLGAYRSLTDWSVLEAVDRWRSATPGSDERRLAAAWEAITSRRLPWKLAYESIARATTDLSGAHHRILDLLPATLRGAHFEVDVASARIVPENPMVDDGLVSIYDPLEETVERSRTVELVARLPEHNQMVRVFSNDESALPALHSAARVALG